MKRIEAVNDFVIKFANVNGTGSASANNMFAKALFRMGLPVSPKNIFPSNIQGLPTWFEVRVNEKGFLGRRGGIDMMVCMNPQSMAKDIKELESGGYFLYDSSKPLDLRLLRTDITFIGIPLRDLCRREFSDPRQQQLFRNVVYVGALAALLDIEFDVLTGLVADQFQGKEKLITSNVRALELVYHYAAENIDCPLGIRVERRDAVGDAILIDGNTASALGAIYRYADANTAIGCDGLRLRLPRGYQTRAAVSGHGAGVLFHDGGGFRFSRRVADPSDCDERFGSGHE
jgi:2-oxoglutarate ferredoxin oxidoreductase subunit alpha